MRCSLRWARDSPTYAPWGMALQWGARSLSRYGSISRPPEPAGTDAGEVEQLLRGVAAEVRGQCATGPLQDDTAVVDGPAHDPPVGREGVAEHLAERVDRRAVHHDAQRPAGADRAGRHTRGHRTETQVRERPVARADDDGRPGRQPGSRGRLGGQLRQHRGGGHQLGELLGLEPRQVQGLGIPLQGGEIQQTGGRRHRVVDDERVAQPQQDVLLDPDPEAHLLEQLGLLLPEPDQLRQRRHGVQRGARPAVQLQPAGRRPQPSGLLAGAGVRPRHDVGERVALGREAQQAVHRGTERERGNRPAVQAVRRSAGPRPAPPRRSRPAPAPRARGTARGAGTPFHRRPRPARPWCRPPTSCWWCRCPRR